MNIALVQFSPWDKMYYFDTQGFKYSSGNKVAVQTESGLEIGEIIGFKEIDKKDPDIQGEEQKLKPILRIATKEDLEKIERRAEKQRAITACKDLIIRHSLPMKLVDVRYSYDGSRLTFAFIADGRVDFRDLVKDLTKQFNCVIRLQQIGIRDEAKMSGDFGHCGMPLCCGRFLKELSSITSEMADLQQCSHRGSDRLSGVCGRLMCCLSYESSGYKELSKKLPAIGTRVNVDGKRGVVVGHHVLKQSVNVEFQGENGDGTTVAEVDLNRHKK